MTDGSSLRRAITDRLLASHEPVPTSLMSRVRRMLTSAVRTGLHLLARARAVRAELEVEELSRIVISIGGSSAGSR